MRALSLALVALFALTLRPRPADPQAPAGQPAPKSADEGVLPVGANGEPLNLDFETGTLQHWRAEGEAFTGQPIKGDTVRRRRGDMKSGHAGRYWVGTFEIKGDPPQGTLTSAPFKVTHPYASFLVGGGAHLTTCVELVRRDTQKVFFRASGQESENMRRVVVDLRPHKGQEIFIRVVDKHSGHWGHINFDDFKFHSAKPNFPQVAEKAAPDVYPYAGLAPEQAAKVMKLPEGFSVTLCAAEPDVRQPIAMALDDRGRLWVAEAYSYPLRRPDKDAKDRILIFEDTTGTGKFDKRTVFYEGLNLVSGLEVGFGGVWVGAAPYLLFIPDRDGDGKPDGPPEIVLDGWGYHDTHETLNTFIWGPDGWLYGCHGIFTHSRVGRPGTPDRQRVPLNAGVWRYHPLKKQFEVFAHGTSNPWGVDFNDRGHAFCTACVVPHLFHMIQGGRYHRQAGAHFNPYTYDDLKTIADHLHWGGANPWAGNDRSDSHGGGHAHCGAMIYLGGAWPETYRDTIFMNNVHGQRVNRDILRPKGSGYVGLHGPDFLLTRDRWSQMLNLRYGPDGQVYLIDWYDRQACHTGNPKDHDRSNGRIFKVSYGRPKHVTVDLKKLKSGELVELQLHANDWYVRHARRLLQERGPDAEVHRALAKFAFDHPDETRRLRGLWALHVTAGLTEELLARALANDWPAVRGWAVQLALEDAKPSAATLARFAEMAHKDPSPVVRLYLASALQRLPVEQRWDILEGLLAHGEDAGDHNLPLMYWYAAEPLGAVDAGKSLALAGRGKIPLLVGFMARRVASLDTPAALDAVVRAIAQREDTAGRLALLRGLGEALKGRRRAAMPASWPEAFRKLAADGSGEVRSLAQGLAVTFGDPQAFAAMRKLLVDNRAGLAARQAALASLLGARDRELAPTLQALLKDGETTLRRAALRGLAAYDHPATATVILDAYPRFTLAEKRDALNTLAARPASAQALLTAIGQKRVASADVSADIIRQLRNLHNADVDRQIAQVWGSVRETTQDKLKEIARYQRLLTDAALPPPNPALGRSVFVKTCQQCHTLFGVGGKVGPDITGSNRADLDYLLANILDPSAVMAKEYMTTIVTTTDGRTLSGIVRQQDKKTVVLVTANETLTLPRDEIDKMRVDNKSMMPDDLLKPLSPAEVRALVAYLRGPAQVPLPATADNVKDFFNGRDLAGWDGDPAVWSVQNGEIVGKGVGRKRDAYLRGGLLVGDFRLTFQFKSGPAGVLFRAEGLPDGGARGYRVGLGDGAWGLLSEAQGRGPLASKAGPAPVKAGEWNRYEIVATGGRIRTLLNGAPWLELSDPEGPRRGIIALQLPAGTAEVRFKNLKLELGK